jgi:serine/threonine protein kinase
MDLIEGESLQATLDRSGPLPPSRALDLTERVARAVHAVHQAGVIHRDIKPANVLLRDGLPLLTDFGLAKAIDMTGSGLTATGEVLGTPATMAPEQALGEHDRIGPPTDVYGLGALLYTLATGRTPFPAGPLLAVLSAVTSKRPSPPSKGNATLARQRLRSGSNVLAPMQLHTVFVRAELEKLSQ